MPSIPSATVPALDVKIDWKAYFREFDQAHGGDPVYYGSETGFERGRAEHEGNRNYYGQARIDAADKSPIYTLAIKLDERHYQVGYRVDDTSTRSELTSSVAYTLTDNRTRKVVLKDAFTETVTYSTSSSPFTGIVSQQDAQERLATSAAQKIQTAVALHFHGK